jgi:hypothetical protein
MNIVTDRYLLYPPHIRPVVILSDSIRLSTDLNPKGAKREQTGVHRGARTVTANYYRPILRQEETKDSQTGMHQLR